MTEAFGCDHCADDQNRQYGHVEQVATHPTESAVLLRCPRCGALYSDSWRETVRLTVEQARREFGWNPSNV